MADKLVNEDALGEDWIVKIYALIDPFTDEVRYIGKTIYEPEERLKGHIKESNKKTNNTHKNNWINSLLIKNIKPNILILDIVKEKGWQFWEQWWIALFKSWGSNLTNHTDGGDGVKSREHQLEIIKKIKYKLSLIENPAKRPEVRKKISEALKGRVISDEWKANMSKNGKGKKMPDSMKLKSKERMLGNQLTKKYLESLTAEDREKIMNERLKRLQAKYKSGELIHPMKGKTHSEEARKKISTSRSGKPSWSKKVKQTNLITGEVTFFESANEANRFYFQKTSDYIANIVRKNKIFKNSIFEYIND